VLVVRGKSHECTVRDCDCSINRDQSVVAENLKADVARRFVMGKFFEFSCFDGSRGAAGSMAAAQLPAPY